MDRRDALTDLCEYLKNWFDDGCPVHVGKITIAEGTIQCSCDFLNSEIQLAVGQYFRVAGSVFNDGVHCYPDMDMVDEVFDGSGIDGIAFGEDGDNPYAFMVFIPIDVDKGFVVYSCNKLFHQLGLLPHNKGLLMGEVVDYCGIVRGGGADGECYVASFNHPIVLGFEESDPRSRFILKNWRECDGDDAD